MQLKKTLIIYTALTNSGLEPTPDFSQHLFLFRGCLTLDWSTCRGFFLLLWVPARFHRNGSRGLVDRTVIHIGTGSSDVHTWLKTQRRHSDKETRMDNRGAEEARERHLWAQRGQHSRVCGSRGSRHAAKDKREAKLEERSCTFIHLITNANQNVTVRMKAQAFTCRGQPLFTETKPRKELSSVVFSVLFIQSKLFMLQ